MSENNQSCLAQLFLSQVSSGTHVNIVRITATGEIRRRLLDMGLVKDTAVKVVRKAPLGDPIIITIKGVDISLRLSEAATIECVVND